MAWARAREIWSSLVAEAPQDAPWSQALRERVAALGAGPETTQDGVAAKIEALPEAGRMNAIRDLEGWLRLVRSYTVLHAWRGERATTPRSPPIIKQTCVTEGRCIGPERQLRAVFIAGHPEAQTMTVAEARPHWQRLLVANSIRADRDACLFDDRRCQRRYTMRTNADDP